MDDHYYFYILRCADASLYCGIAKDISAREKQHNSGKGSTYVKTHGGGAVIYSEQYPSRGDALRREAEVKKWAKIKKEALIAS